VTEAVQVALIATLPGTLVGSAALIVAIKGREAVKDVHLLLNSRLDELLNTTKKLAHAEGLADGQREKE
jgi:hypothetical protein